jgi:hypothetical protein
MPNSKHLTYDISNLVSLITKIKLGLSQHHITVRHLTLKIYLSMDDLTLKITHGPSDAKSTFSDSLSDVIDIHF